MIDINRKYEFNEDEVKRTIAEETEKRNRLEHELQTQKEAYEKKIKSILDQRVESQMDLTAFYMRKIEYLETELGMSS